VSPPAVYLHNAFYDITYLPYRQLELFAAWLFPKALGLTNRFDPVRYANYPTDLTVSHRVQDGRWIEMSREIPRDVLLAQAKQHLRPQKHAFVPRALSNIVDGDDHAYIREIARQAAAHGTQLIFVYIPIFNGAPAVEDKNFLRQYGLVLEYSDLPQQDKLYQGWAHLNHAGAMVLSDRVARALQPYV
jgi:hypothetical protein